MDLQEVGARASNLPGLGLEVALVRALVGCVGTFVGGLLMI